MYFYHSRGYIPFNPLPLNIKKYLFDELFELCYIPQISPLVQLGKILVLLAIGINFCLSSWEVAVVRIQRLAFIANIRASVGTPWGAMQGAWNTPSGGTEGSRRGGSSWCRVILGKVCYGAEHAFELLHVSWKSRFGIFIYMLNFIYNIY